MSQEGLWISPEGEVVPVVEHLAEIAKNPETFGLTQHDVRGASIHALRMLAEQLITDRWTRYRDFGDKYLFEQGTLKRDVIEQILLQAGAFGPEKVIIELQNPKVAYCPTVEEFYTGDLIKCQRAAGISGWRVSE